MGFISDLIKGDQEDGSEDINVEVKSNGNNKEFKNKTILVEPRAFSEAQQIADYLKGRNQVVVNFKRVTSDVSKRIMDFLNGIVYAIDGTMQKLGRGIVLCAPKGFEIEGSISDEDTKKGSKKENQDYGLLRFLRERIRHYRLLLYACPCLQGTP